MDLPTQTVTTPEGRTYRFETNAFQKNCLLKGLDAIGLTLQHEDAIAAYERRRLQEAPWLFADLARAD